jgi:hypothetical protein
MVVLERARLRYRRRHMRGQRYGELEPHAALALGLPMLQAGLQRRLENGHILRKALCVNEDAPCMAAAAGRGSGSAPGPLLSAPHVHSPGLPGVLATERPAADAPYHSGRPWPGVCSRWSGRRRSWLLVARRSAASARRSGSATRGSGQGCTSDYRAKWMSPACARARSVLQGVGCG